MIHLSDAAVDAALAGLVPTEHDRATQALRCALAERQVLIVRIEA